MKMLKQINKKITEVGVSVDQRTQKYFKFKEQKESLTSLSAHQTG